LEQIKKGPAGYTQPDLKAVTSRSMKSWSHREGGTSRALCGGGIISSGAAAELKKFAEATNIPVTTTIMGIGGFPETHPLSLRWLGMHGSASANWAVNGEYEKRANFDAPMVKLKDARICCSRSVCVSNDRVTGKFEEFCKTGTIVHIDIDASELNKNRKANLPVVGDIKDALTRLTSWWPNVRSPRNTRRGSRRFAEWQKKAPFAYRITSEIANSDHMKDHLAGQESEVILQQMVIEMLFEMTKGEAYITTGVGQHQMWAAQWYKIQTSAPVHHQRRPGLDGLWLSRRARVKVALLTSRSLTLTATALS